MELRHLRYFCAIAEEMHVTRAAERLHVAQPALTQQIKSLESELQTQLLRRVGRGIELTEAGRVFWPEAQRILERVRVAGLLAQEAARGFVGRLAVGLTETVSFAPPVTRVLKQTHERWPNVELSLSQARSNDLLTALADRRIDVAFMRPPPPDAADLQSQSFLKEGLLVACPNDHPLALDQSITLSAIAGTPLILPRGRAGHAGLRTMLAAAFANQGYEPNVVQETPEYVMAINLVAAGLGIAIVPAALEGLRPDAIVYRPLRSKPALQTEIIIVSRAKDLSPVLANFLRLAAELAPRSPRERDRSLL